MLKNNRRDSSSSDEGIFVDALKEATDHHFLKQSFFSTTECRNLRDTRNTTQDLSVPKSLRRNLEEQDEFENFGTTPEFKQFVARKLHQILEESVELENREDAEPLTKKVKREDDDFFGIKLLNNPEKVNTQNIKKWKLCKKKCVNNLEDDTRTNLVKCREVAVSPKWILSMAETKAWTERRRGTEFRYKKLNNGLLVEDK